MEEKYYIIGYGLGGGFGGIQDYEVVKAKTIEEAQNVAYELACETYDSYAGSNGLRTVDEIAEEELCSIDAAEVCYIEDTESWIDYTAVLWSKEEEEKVEGYHYDNKYREETDKLK